MKQRGQKLPGVIYKLERIIKCFWANKKAKKGYLSSYGEVLGLPVLKLE
jgi:hypothetical protein